MQFRFVAVALAAFAAGVSAQNSTNGTSTGLPQPTPTENAGLTNAVSMGSFALVVAGVVAAAF